ncbi:MAG: hypothetical protein LW720_07360 [Pirellula sp.]|nr:hypothetical protein [Pirellula sp.]
MKLFKILAIAAMAMVSSVSAQAGALTNVVLSNLGSDGTSAVYNQSTDLTGARLSGSGFTVGASDFYLNAINVAVFGGGDITASIVNNNGGNPGATVFATRTLTGVTSAAQTVTFNFNDFQLTANQSYFVTLKSTGTAAAWYGRGTVPAVFPPGGLTYVSSRFASNGTNWDDNGLAFEIAYSGSTVNPVPEPALTSLLCLSGIALIRRRMKK